MNLCGIRHIENRNVLSPGFPMTAISPRRLRTENDEHCGVRIGDDMVSTLLLDLFRGAGAIRDSSL
jgi:hypothetical protein